MKAFSYAKINLTLDVYQKPLPNPPLPGEGIVQEEKNNNFHTIQTIFHKISLADEIEIEKSDEFQIVGHFSCKIEDNLIFKAFELIQKYFPNAPKIRVKVTKNIPEKAGLGGGSSNFATFVKLYFEFFQLGSVPQKLIEESGDFGKDIPFFFYESPCMIGENFGEQIKTVPFNENKFSGTPVYIYKPDFENCTKTMYQHLKEYKHGFTSNFLESLELKDCGNTFDEFLKESKYQNILKGVDTSKIHLCGSGSSFFSFEKIPPIDCNEIKVILL